MSITTAPTEVASAEVYDYYAVYVQRHAKGTPRFLLHAYAKSKADALRAARNDGHSLPRGSYARKVGKEGYYAALRYAFRMPPTTP